MTASDGPEAPGEGREPAPGEAEPAPGEVEPGEAEPASDQTGPGEVEPASHPALAEADRALERGDYAAVRELLAPLARGDDDALRAGADARLTRLRVDRRSLVIGAVCAAALVAIFAGYVVW